MPHDDGGPAFPQVGTWLEDAGGEGRDRLYLGHPGMTLHAWFMGQAVAGELANPEGVFSPEQLAERCAEHADACIAEIRKRQNGDS